MIASVILINRLPESSSILEWFFLRLSHNAIRVTKLKYYTPNISLIINDGSADILNGKK